MEELIKLNPYMMHVRVNFKKHKYVELKDHNVPDWYIWMVTKIN